MNLRTFKNSFLCHTYKFPVSRVKINGTFKIECRDNSLPYGEDTSLSFQVMLTYIMPTAPIVPTVPNAT